MPADVPPRASVHDHRIRNAFEKAGYFCSQTAVGIYEYEPMVMPGRKSLIRVGEALCRGFINLRIWRAGGISCNKEC